MRGLAGQRRDRGLTLLETLLATFMFVTVMVSMMDVWVAHARAFDKGQNQQVAGFLAQQIMEQQLTLGYNIVGSGVAVPFTTPTSTYKVDRIMRGVPETSDFAYNVTVDAPGGSEAVPGPGWLTNPSSPALMTEPSFYVVVVTLTWHDATGDHTLTMECDDGW